MGIFLAVYISQLIRFARVSNHIADFKTRKQVLTAKLLKQGYRYNKIRKTFTKFYRHHCDLVSTFNLFLNEAYRNLNFMATSYTNLRKLFVEMIFLNLGK